MRPAPQARVRVERRGRAGMAVSAFAGDAVQFAVDNRRLLSMIAAGALAALAILLAVAELPGALRAPAITLGTTRSADQVLLEGRFPAQPAAEGLEAAVVKILRVRQHEVKAGETISEIASRYGLRLGTLINFNAIADARSIPVGRSSPSPTRTASCTG